MRRPGASRRTRPSSPGGSADQPAREPPSSRESYLRFRSPSRAATWSCLATTCQPYPLPMPEPAFDPSAPLASAPEPWASTSQPSLRDGPPYHMTEMIAAEPAIAARILERLADPMGAAGQIGRASRREG